MPENDLLFTETGFAYFINNKKGQVIWKEVVEIIAYKLDLFTTDCVCVDIVLADKVITLSEEIEEWESFVKEMQTSLPSIDPGWEWKVIQPPFATNLTTIYKK